MYVMVFQTVDLSAISKIIKMKGEATAQAVPEGIAPVSKRRWLRVLLLVVVVVVVGGGLAVWHWGSAQAHQPSIRPLYSSFDESPTHKKLLSQLQKGKLSVVTGKREDGLLHFAQHLANKLTQKGPVFIEDLDHPHFEYFQLAKKAKGHIGGLIGDAPVTGDWILLSLGGAFAEEISSKLAQANPKARIVVVSSAALKIKGFKNFAFPQVEEKLLEGIIAKSLQVKPLVADILHDYFGSAEEAFLRVNGSKFDQKQLLGDNHKGLDGLTKEEKMALQGLCTKGSGKAKQESPKLLDLGVVHLDGVNYWKSLDSILNYELAAAVNCKNSVATPAILEASETARAKAAEEKKAREEAQAKKEEERKAAEEAKKAAQAQAKQQGAKKESVKEKSKSAKKGKGKA